MKIYCFFIVAFYCQSEQKISKHLYINLDIKDRELVLFYRNWDFFDVVPYPYTKRPSNMKFLPRKSYIAKSGSRSIKITNLCNFQEWCNFNTDVGNISVPDPDPGPKRVVTELVWITGSDPKEIILIPITGLRNPSGIQLTGLKLVKERNAGRILWSSQIFESESGSAWYPHF